ncbi:MAG TPA: hypothetical protein VHE60_01930 [Pyrinomonadaceae bacterium]|nr:hypothetical protein [Pyrinomonadaceae bacterium]
MKRCPKCNRTYTTNTQKFCTHDGGILVALETPEADTIRIDSAQLDAPTKAISRELVPDSTEKFDPYRTTIGQSPAASGRTEPRARITQDLEPVEPPPPPPETSAPSPPSDSGTLPSLPPPPTQPAQPSPKSASKPITTSAPLPTTPSTLSTQFPGAAQAQQVRPLAAAGPKKKSKLPWVIGILAVLLVLGVVLGVVAYIVVPRMIPGLQARRTALPTPEPSRPVIDQPTPNVETTPTNTETPNPIAQNEPPPYSPPSDGVEFVNSNKNLDGKLAEHYVDFSFYYPERWEKDAKAGVPGATNFAKVERRLPPDFTQENFAVGWYSSSGSATDDRALFPTLAQSLSAQFEKNFPDYRKVSEGETKAGAYDGYEFRFESTSRNTAKGDLKVWGRVIFLPPVDGGKNGVTLLMLATSLAPELRSIDDVGAKGELPMLLESFRFGKKN